jgi:hypothetical protein
VSSHHEFVLNYLSRFDQKILTSRASKRTSYEVTKRITFEEQVTDININGLQEMVDK